MANSKFWSKAFRRKRQGVGWPAVWLLLTFKNSAKTFNLDQVRLFRSLYDYSFDRNLIYEQWTACITYIPCPWSSWEVLSTPISKFWLDSFGEKRARKGRGPDGGSIAWWRLDPRGPWTIAQLLSHIFNLGPFWTKWLFQNFCKIHLGGKAQRGEGFVTFWSFSILVILFKIDQRSYNKDSRDNTPTKNWAQEL